MDAPNPVAQQRLDYQRSNWSIPHTRLSFELDPCATRVTSELSLRYDGPVQEDDNDALNQPLALHGVALQLESVRIDGHRVAEDQYRVSDTELMICAVPRQCVLTLVCVINPQANTALEGLYRSGGNFCTQCEAEGFRKITYYIDRPDVLSVFDVSISADATDYPVLLSNGNRVSQERLSDGRLRVHWHDPHPKPCYLFALVAGNLPCIEDSFTTASGRSVLLQIYTEEHNIGRCDFAMASLKAAMRWDEEVYGLEYDLDCFMIVAVDDFNMGAMENKGLNIFNTRFVLADAQSATDTDYLSVEAVVAHEYFHNWTGNRTTCRDWFQLSLKEGLTVFRDQCFSSDQHSASVKRIEDVRLLRTRQFPEDAGPMAHPIRPESYIEINNFYTVTVYEKGAEVIRMLHTLLGSEAWHQGINTYIARHDGTATTCDAFVDAMQAVTDQDLTQFRLWYSTAGTPEITVSEHYDVDTQQYRLTLQQYCPDTPGQTHKAPLHIPMVMGLLNAQGDNMALSTTQAGARACDGGMLIDITQAEQTFVFNNIDEAPVASLFRHFCAPVKLHHPVSDRTLAFLMAHDSDAFNRWDAGQRLAGRVILGLLKGDIQHGSGDNADSAQALIHAYGQVLNDNNLDAAFKAEALTLPAINTLAEMLPEVDYEQLCAAQAHVSQTLAGHYAQALVDLVSSARPLQRPLLDPQAMSARKLANTALGLLAYLPSERWESLALAQYQQADNMTDRLAALAVLCHGHSDAREQCLTHFHDAARHNRLVMDKWFAVQAMARRVNVVDDVIALSTQADFDPGNPNRFRSLVASFAMNNPAGFHATDGRGYRFLSDQIIALDKRNPQVAAGMVAPLGRWRRLVPSQQRLMRAELQRIMDVKPLSADVFELVSKSLE